MIPLYGDNSGRKPNVTRGLLDALGAEYGFAPAVEDLASCVYALLDDIRPERWTPRMSEEFLELLWVLEATLAMEPQLKDALDKVVAGSCFTACELPQPRPHERKPPAKSGTDGELLKKMGGTEVETSV